MMLQFNRSVVDFVKVKALFQELYWRRKFQEV